MKSIYSSPFRVYLVLGFLAALGVFSGLHLPISLFPNSAKPKIFVELPYSDLSAEEFVEAYGKRLEESLKTLTAGKARVQRVEALYRDTSVHYLVEFFWGSDPQEALKETRNLVLGFSSQLPEETRRGLGVFLENENSGFFAMSFFSETRDLNDLYDLLEPLLTPALARVQDAEMPMLWNPSSREVHIELLPEMMASFGLLPRDIDAAVRRALAGRTGGSVSSGFASIQIEMPRQFDKPQSLERILIPTRDGKTVHLSEVARVSLGKKTMGSRSFSTNGAPSLILFAAPRAGGNIKRMSEEMLAAVQQLAEGFPSDVQYRVLVDPSEFIRSAVTNVVHEVILAALLAVAVLFLFIGSFRNVATAAIEIPMSMVLAFILMRWSGMNLNLISLGGLALSAGMNVDASVVVMENIFRHFELNPGAHDARTRLRLVVQAVREVRFPIVASTVASLVVFLPLIFTSGLSYGILGDLALAVIFSHGLSAIIALILVPTIRLQLMSLPGATMTAHSPIEHRLHQAENLYVRLLERFLENEGLRYAAYGLAVVLFLVFAVGVLPRLPQEVIGRPDTDWLELNVSTDGNDRLSQMEHKMQEIEKSLLAEFGEKIAYTFTQVRSPNGGHIMARLKNKRDMNDLWKAMEKTFTNTPLIRYGVYPWNPSELPIPDPPEMELTLRGGDAESRADAASELYHELEQAHTFPKIHTDPPVRRDRKLVLFPLQEQWSALQKAGSSIEPSDLSDLSRVATTGREITTFPIGTQSVPIVMAFSRERFSTLEDILAIPIGVGAKIVPLNALARGELRYSRPMIRREDGRETIRIRAEVEHGDEARAAQRLQVAHGVVDRWRSGRPAGDTITATFTDPAPEVTEAKQQLVMSALLSVALVFVVLCFQFGSIVEPLIVLVSIPLGIIGVSLSLAIFRSTVSLNSILGIILLNGISVANSLILVDFAHELARRGIDAHDAVLQAARARLRPILITSLTTVLGMLPIALGFGEGGSILQPLGIAVSGGLWFSMSLTLFLVPALHSAYLARNSETPLRERLVDLLYQLRDLGEASLRWTTRVWGSR